MEFKGKKIYFLGDSITEGVGASDAEHCYVSVFGKLSGAIVKNYGISATRIACQTENLTTKEPDDRMIEVAIASVEAVFDWKAYLAENFPSCAGQKEGAV